MPYVNITPSNFNEAIGRLMGQLKAKLKLKVQKEIKKTKISLREVVSKLKTEIRKNGLKVAAVTLAPVITKIISTVEPPLLAIKTQVREIDKTAEGVRKIPDQLKPVTSTLKTALNLILTLPIPQAVPPGIGLPISITTKYANTLHLVKESIVQIDEIISGVTATVDSVYSITDPITLEVSKMLTILESLKVEKALLDHLNSGGITVEALQKAGLVDMDEMTIFSRLTGTLVEDGTSTGQLGVVNLVQQLGGVEVDDDTIISKLSTTAIDGSSPTSMGSADPSTVGTVLGKVNTSLVEKAILKLDTSGLSSDTKRAIKELLDQLQRTNETTTAGDINYTYRAANGKVFTLAIVEDLNTSTTFPRHFAIAKDSSSVTVMVGPKSFSYSTTVLLDEIKFRLDQLK